MVVFLVSLQCGLNKIGNHSKRASLGLSLSCYWTFFLLKDFNSCGRNSKTAKAPSRELTCVTLSRWRRAWGLGVSCQFHLVPLKGWGIQTWQLPIHCRQNQGLASEVLFWESGSVEKMQGSGAVLWFCLHFVITNYSWYTWLLCMLILFLPIEIKCGPSVLPCILLPLRKGSREWLL